MNIGIVLALALTQDVQAVDPAFSVRKDRPQLSFKLKVSEGTLLGVEILKAGVTAWSDDQGTTLGLKDAKQFYGEASVMTMGSGADLVATVQGKHKPRDGAKTMTLEGEVPVKIGLDLREGEAKGVTLKEGASFAVGPYTFKVAKVENAKDSFNFKIQEVRRVTFTFDVPQQLTSSDFLKEFKFLTEDGKVHPSSQKNFQGSFKGGGEHRLTFAILPTDPPLTVKWAVYAKINTVTVPLKHSGPIGK